MASANITEIKAGYAEAQALGVPAPQLPALVVTDVTFSTPTLHTFTSETRCILYVADAESRILVGKPQDNPNAKTTTGTKINSGVAVFLGVYPGYVMSIYDGVS